MTLPITIPFTFATATGSLPLSQLDSDFTVVANAVNGIADGTNALPSVNITGGNIANATYTGQPFSPTNGFKRNRVINGSMQIDQRNSGAAQTITTAGAYTVDRWLAVPTGASVTGQQVAGPTGYQYAYRITGAASVTGILFQHRIESFNCADFVNQNVALSVNISNSLLTTVTWTAYYANTANNFAGGVTQIATGTFTVSSTAAQYTATFNAGANAANGIAIQFSVGAQTSGTWTVTGVQLEAGSYATPFERQIYSDVLSQCQRYYEAVNFGSNITIGSASVGTSFNPPNAQGLFFPFKVTKRTAASMSSTAASTFSVAGVSATSIGLSADAFGATIYSLQAGSGNTGSSWTSVFVAAGSSGASLFANAEL
jgi:hypothetical protein